jgi:hypothetical protein
MSRSTVLHWLRSWGPWLAATALVLLGVATAESYVGYRSSDWQITGPVTGEPERIPDPNPEGWARLRSGVSREEVQALLGVSASQHPRREQLVPGWASPEVWEYGWSHLPMGSGGQCPYSRTVYFDATGRLSAWREPEATAPVWLRLGFKRGPTPWWVVAAFEHHGLSAVAVLGVAAVLTGVVRRRKRNRPQ